MLRRAAIVAAGAAAGVLSPNDVRIEEGWPASCDPTADSIEPPVAGAKQPAEEPADELPKPALPPSDDDEEKIDKRRARVGIFFLGVEFPWCCRCKRT
jgi:hypothetical protein